VARVDHQLRSGPGLSGQAAPCRTHDWLWLTYAVGTWQNPPVTRPSETDRVARAIAGRAEGGFALVSIDGAGGSGKSTLAADLAERLGGMGPATVVHGDDFYRPMRAAERLLLSPQEGYSQYFDWQRLRDQVLIPLTSGTGARYQRYARPELADYYDLTVLVEAPRDVCLRRLHERGHDHGPGNWNERWRAAEEHYLVITNPGARLDLTVEGY
jgi:uridine kinase